MKAKVVVNNDDMAAYIGPEGRWKLIYDVGLCFVELYDLDSDPLERRNLADERPDVLAELKLSFLRWRASVLGG